MMGWAVEVTQADRDAAAAMWNRHAGLRSDFSRRLENGEEDHDYSVQAFARHRLAATRPDPVKDDLLAALEALDAFWLEDWLPPHPDPDQQEPRLLTKQTLTIWRNARAAIAAARSEQS